MHHSNNWNAPKLFVYVFCHKISWFPIILFRFVLYIKFFVKARKFLFSFFCWNKGRKRSHTSCYPCNRAAWTHYVGWSRMFGSKVVFRTKISIKNLFKTLHIFLNFKNSEWEVHQYVWTVWKNGMYVEKTTSSLNISLCVFIF